MVLQIIEQENCPTIASLAIRLYIGQGDLTILSPSLGAFSTQSAVLQAEHNFQMFLKV